MLRVVLLSLFGVLASTAFAADAKFVKIVHVETGKVMSIEEGSTEPEARAVLAKDGTGAEQLWTVVKDGNYFKLVNKKSGKVLDVNDDSRDEGASIIQWDSKDEGTDNQRWSWDGKGDEQRLKSKSSGMVVVPDADGKLIQKKADDKSKSPLWKVVEVKP